MSPWLAVMLLVFVAFGAAVFASVAILLVRSKSSTREVTIPAGAPVSPPDVDD
jgi:hypothetical protein